MRKREEIIKEFFIELTDYKIGEKIIIFRSTIREKLEKEYNLKIIIK